MSPRRGPITGVYTCRAAVSAAKGSSPTPSVRIQTLSCPRADFKVSRIQSDRLCRVKKDDRIGFPNMGLVSTSFVECSNLTIRMHCRRLTRLTNAFSKRLENFKRAMDLYFCYYNFVRFHKTIKMTPAMEAGVARSPMTVKDLVEMAQ